MTRGIARGVVRGMMVSEEMTRVHVLDAEANDCIGSMSVNSDLPVWENVDWDNGDELDTDEMRQDHPEGFEYDCCGGAGNSVGCKRGEHKAAEDEGVETSVPEAKGEAGGKASENIGE